MPDHERTPRGRQRPASLSAALSRRDFLRYAGYGAVALSQLDLLPSAAQAQGRSRVTLHPMALPGSGVLQLPFWSDAGWSQPEYYETIQTGLRRLPRNARSYTNSTYADVNNDGQDELIGRGPQGLLVNVYDPTSGQWLPMQAPLDANGKPIWTDAEGWGQPAYYQTIQTVSLAAGFYSALGQLLARDINGIELWGYNFNQGTPNYGKWVQFTSGPAWSDAAGWDQPQCYETIQAAMLTSGNTLIGRGPDGIEAWTCQNVDVTNPNSMTWTRLADGPAWSDAAGWNLPQYYETIQCADLNGNNQAELIGQGPDGLEV
jgi:hypothetical protein